MRILVRKTCIISLKFTIRIMNRLGRRFWSGKPFMLGSVLVVRHWSDLEGKQKNIHQGQEFVLGWGMNCLSTGMIGSSTVVGLKLDMWSITMTVARSTRTTSLPFWTCVPPSIRSLQCGIEWRSLGGAGLHYHCFVHDEKDIDYFLERYIKLFIPNWIALMMSWEFHVGNHTWSFT